MITTIVRAASHHIHIEVPPEFIGQDVQVVMFVEQKELLSSNPKNAAQYKGLFTEEEAEQFQHYLKEARSEWDRAI